MFNVLDDVWTRLQDYTFTQEFAIVTARCGRVDTRKIYKLLRPASAYSLQPGPLNQIKESVGAIGRSLAGIYLECLR